MRPRRYRLAVILPVLILPAIVVAQEQFPEEGSVRFPITMSDSVVTRQIDSALVLEIRRARHARIATHGWYVTVETANPPADYENLLEHDRPWHVPLLTDVLAFLHRQQYFPDDRSLTVYGHPYEVRIRLIECITGTDGTDVWFESGTLEVSWKRRALDHPAAGM